MKKIRYCICLYLFSTPLIFSTVGPIFPGESLWKITERIGITTDIIESKVCELDDAAPCDFLIFQTDIPLTITQPGKYCLAESIDFSNTDTAIRIASDNVILDLNCHCMDGGDNGAFAIYAGIPAANPQDFTGFNNVVIKNGTIKNYIYGGIFVTNSFFGTEIKDIKCSSFFTGNPFGAGPGILVQTCTGAKITNSCVTGGGNRMTSEAPTIGGALTVVLSDDCIVNNCVARNADQQPGFDITACSRCCFVACKAFLNGDQGFRCQRAGTLPGCRDHNLFLNCIAEDNFSQGFLIFESDYNELRNCISHINGQDGILIRANNCLVDHCSAMANNTSLPGIGAGIFISGVSPSVQTSETVVVDCKVSDDFERGIFIDGSHSNVIRTSEITGNALNGIEMSLTATFNKIVGCVINDNAGIGISDIGSNNIILNNCALNNTLGNFPGLDPLLTATSNPAIAGANYWINVSL